MDVTPGTPVNSRPRWYRMLVWVGMVLCTLGALAIGRTYDPVFTAFLVLPLFPIPFALLLRPSGEISHEDPEVVGATLGHWWVTDDHGQTVFVDRPTAAALLERVKPRPPVHETTLDGFSGELEAPGERAPAAGWFTGVAHRAATSMTWVMAFGVMLYAMDVIAMPSASFGSVLGPAFDGGGPPLNELLGALVLSTIVSVGMGLYFTVALLPVRMLLAAALGTIKVIAGNTPIQLTGRVLDVGGRRVHLAEPGWSARLALERDGVRLLLENGAQTVDIPGRADELAWVAQQVRSRANAQGEHDEVPEPLQQMRRNKLKDRE